MGAGSAEQSRSVSDVPLTHRKASAREVPAAWLDRLLMAASDVAPETSVAGAVATILDAVAQPLEGVALGVCAPDENSGQIVVRRNAREGASAGSDPTRLFPEFLSERVFEIPHDEGSTLHVACDDGSLLADQTPLDGFADRLALALGSTIRNARAFARTARHAAELRGLQAQVIQSEKLASLGQIAAGIVHELNNPLTSIVAYSDYLRRKAERSSSDPTDIERLRRINEAADRILRFSRDLIAYSRPSAEVPAPVAIHDIIDRALVFCEHVLDQTGVQVERDFADVPAVRGVAGQLTQVFVNLFTNAAQAMQESGGNLRIVTRLLNETEVAVTISDEGHGIDSDHLPRIFEPFFTTKTDGTGTGLGLSIVRNIVQAHGGRIRAGGAVPRGTVFFVELPIAAQP